MHSEKFTLGIDIGGTTTCFGVVNSKGDILVRGQIPTKNQKSFDAFISMLHTEISDRLTESGISKDDVAAIGVGAPCLNPFTGVIEGAVDLPWSSPLPLVDKLKEIFNVPVAGENDANAAALGEMYYGDAKNFDNFIMITLGTGVGSAIICDGHLLHGKRGLAGELGHSLIRKGKRSRLCGCGRRGCLEMYASARGVVATAEELLQKYPDDSKLRNCKELTAKVIGNAARDGDSIAKKTMEETGKYLGEACADFATFSSPEAIIFFGGVAQSFDLFEPSLKKAFNNNLLWIYKDQIKIIRSGLKDSDAAILGNAAVGRSLLMKNCKL